MLNKNEIPSTSLLVQAVMYLAVVVALGASFSFSLDLLNKVFILGAALTLANVLLSLFFVRHVAAKHFTNQDS
jgi:uncharacterized membrane protein